MSSGWDWSTCGVEWPRQSLRSERREIVKLHLPIFPIYCISTTASQYVHLNTNAFQDQKPSEMLIAEVTTADLRKTRYQVESKDDIRKTQQGYKIETADGEVVRVSENEVESISVTDE